ncbi:MAG: hypothetical protein AAF383_14635 [Cyanobacteria bacterium P01_A01_bin.83]
MGQQNGFGSGFILGSIVGGVVGGVLGTILTTRNERQVIDQDNSRLKNNNKISLNNDESIELARHGLEDKIAQLNLAIDEVRQQLGSVEANPSETEEFN